MWEGQGGQGDTEGLCCCHLQPVIEEQSAQQSHPTVTTSPARPYPGELGTVGTSPQGLSLPGKFTV